jgi:hypothetical protein
MVERASYRISRGASCVPGTIVVDVVVTLS